MIRGLGVLSGAIGVALLFASCGGGGGEGGKGGGDPVRFWHGMGGPLGRSLSGLVSDFDATHETPVESVSMGNYTALSQKIMAAVAAGGPPDVAQCYEAWTANLVDNGALVPFSRFLEGPTGLTAESFADIRPIFLETASQSGDLWAFPFNKSVRCLYYNRDLFLAAGLDPDSPPRTWADYREVARALTRDEDGDGRPETWGLAGQITASVFENLLVQNGGSLLNEDETAVAFDSPAGLEALEFMADLLVRDRTALLSQGFDYQNEFFAGKIGMIEGSSVSLAFMEGKFTFDLGIAPLPAGKLDTQLVAGTDVVIFASSPAREAAAWEFVKWFTDTAQTARWSAETGYLPVRLSAMDDPVLKAKLDSVPGLREAYAQLDRALPQPKAPGWYEGRNILEREAIEPVLRGTREPAEALRIAAERANAALAEAAR